MDGRQETSGGQEAPRGSRLRCWFCGDGFEPAEVERDGILRSRSAREGGPYCLYPCPSCGRASHCERSRAGRWFSSPSFQPNFLEYLLGAFTEQPQDFLRAAAWYKENAERRRYFFERDGDRRYSSSSWWRWLFPASSPRPETATGAKSSQAESREKTRRQDSENRDRGEERAEARPRAQRGFVSPWELLGLEEGAQESDIRRAFHRLAVQYHPDKVHHLGDEFQELAGEKFKELQRAYEVLLRRARKS